MNVDALLNKEYLQADIESFTKQLKQNNELLSNKSLEFVKQLEDKANKETTGEISYLLGFVYLGNELVRKDVDKAVGWFKKSIELEFYQAAIALAILYHYGNSVKEDKELVSHMINEIFDNDAYDQDFNDGSELYTLIKNESKKNDFEITKEIADFYYRFGKEADNIPGFWTKYLDRYFLSKAISWYSILADLGDKSANFKIYQIYDEYKFETPECFYKEYLIKAAKEDKYEPAIKLYKELQELYGLEDDDLKD